MTLEVRPGESYQAKLYIAGPMTGHPSFNIPAFDALARILRGLGYAVVSPAELDDPRIRAISMASPDGAIATLESHGQTWADFLARDVKLISDGSFDGIVVLPGWEKSRGARLETFVGSAMNGLRVSRLGRADVWGEEYLTDVSDLELFRAWCAEPLLTIAHTWLAAER